MDFYFKSGGWAELLLNATEIPNQFSLSYGLDLRYLFIRHWVLLLENEGFPVLRQPLAKYIMKDARIVNHEPLVHNFKNLDTSFCFGYGFANYSYKAINYSNRLEALPKNFICDTNTISLGNVAIMISSLPSNINIYPPSELAISGFAEIPVGKTRCILAWFGIRYVDKFIEPSLVKKVNSIDSTFIQAQPLDIRFHNESSPKQRYVQYYKNGPYSKITDYQEEKLRRSYNYPVKGKTGIRERMLYDSTCLIFGEENVIRRYRGHEMEELELDVWIPSYKIGLEYQGEQHIKHIPHWHGENGFDDQKKRDAYKSKLCKKLGYKLMLFGPGDNLDFVTLLEKLRREWWI